MSNQTVAVQICEICGKPAIQATRDLRAINGSWLEFTTEYEYADDKIHWRCSEHPREFRVIGDK